MSFFTPFELGIILHYYCRADEHESRHAPIFQSVADRLVEMDLLVRTSHGTPTLQTTERGKAFVEIGLMRTAIPVQVWTMPATGNQVRSGTCELNSERSASIVNFSSGDTA